MSVDFYPAEYWRIDDSDEYRERVTLNVASANARNLLVSLGLSADDLCGEIAPTDLLTRLQAVVGKQAEFTRDEDSGVGAKGAQWWEAALRPDQMTRYWERLKAIADEARDLGRLVVWG